METTAKPTRRSYCKINTDCVIKILKGERKPNDREMIKPRQKKLIAMDTTPEHLKETYRAPDQDSEGGWRLYFFWTALLSD
jgi:hypothetical protein